MDDPSTVLNLTSLDNTLLLIADRVTWSVQFEVGIDGQLDVERLQQALRSAVFAHPIAGGRLSPQMPDSADRRHWVIPRRPAPIDCPVVNCLTAQRLGDLRSRLYSHAPDLDRSPAFEVAIARRPGGDLVLFNFSHIAFDGISAARFATSVIRAYSGVDDPQPAPPLADARDLKVVVGRRSMRDVVRWVRRASADNRIKREGIVRIYPDGGALETGEFGFATRAISESATAAINSQRKNGQTFNDVIVAALLLTIVRWNREHGASVEGRPYAHIPVNLRPAQWQTEVVSNVVGFCSVSLPRPTPDRLGAAAAEIHSQTQHLKDTRAAGMLISILEFIYRMPPFVKRQITLDRATEADTTESTVLSNLGARAFEKFGEHSITDLWFSPPAYGAMPIALGACTIDGRLRLSFRHLTNHLSSDAAERFASLYLRTLGVAES